MRKIWWFLGMLPSLVILTIFVWRSSQNSVLGGANLPNKISLTEKTIRYERRVFKQSEAHILYVPSQSEFLVTPVVSPNLETVEKFAQKYQAIATINGGFFDPNNQKTTSNIIIQGKLIANPRENERLVNNPDLKSYLNQIFNRTEFRRYTCNTDLADNSKANSTVRYDIAFHNDPLPTGCQLVNALGGGPKLLPDLTLVQEGFVDKAKSRDALGSTQLNARSAVGITRDGSIILVMISQKPKASLSGMSLPALADFMKSLGVEKAMNLDGGSSSSLYYNGKIFLGKVDLEGNPVKRPVKSVLLVRKTF
ncbi:phosphodiester glycosidase family protein [Scytonema sp. UIC 10036]|uniref:phosphodiester glycosidase family protein n=1 Tax=Scytonema sp. UIC 10036 TaxID=2304196 RepID=UPI0012DA0C09|nr:phosphodiester glycosidase family protein [Scytonema sp. UIC 10036]MUG98217.1 phosphodiester glycosidase family protein [Scytonema sp. UIC 10036]